MHPEMPEKIRGELKSEMENGGGEFFNGYRK